MFRHQFAELANDGRGLHPVSSAKDLPERAQVVIVGGGVTGCSIAYHLAHLGWTDVVLLEQHQLTAGTTWHAAGLITSAGMTDETALFFSRYSRDLYARLEEETGHSTGFRAVGHLSPGHHAAAAGGAAPRGGLDARLRRRGHEISRRELADMWPLARTDDVLSAFYVADEGRADPVGVATSLAKGARRWACGSSRAWPRPASRHAGGGSPRVSPTAAAIETEVVVNAAGMWARQFGALAGVCVPLQAAEHYYLLTDTVPGMDHDLPVDRGPRQLRLLPARGRRDAGRACSSRSAAPWSLDGVPRQLRVRQAAAGLGADGAVPRRRRWTGSRRCPTSGCGRSSAARSRSPPTSGRCSAPRPSWTATSWRPGLNSLGILSGGGVGSMVAHWIVDGVPPVDVTGVRHRPDRAVRDVPAVPRRAHRRAARGAVRRRGLADLEAVDRARTCAARCCTTGWSRRARTSASRPAGSSPSGSTRRGRHRP